MVVDALKCCIFGDGPGNMPDQKVIMATTTNINVRFEIVLYDDPFVDEHDDLLLPEQQVRTKDRDPGPTQRWTFLCMQSLCFL